MTLIAILLALALERMLSYSPAWRAHDLTGRWMALIDSRLSPRPWSLALYLLPPWLLVVVVVLIGAPAAGGTVIALPLSVLLLLACLGPRDLGEEINSYLAARRDGREAQAEDLLRDLISGPCRADSSRVGRSPVAAAFVQGHERWLSVLLWFFVLGAPGAVGYRLAAAVACHLREVDAPMGLLKPAEKLHGLLAWPSARLAVLLYALAGSTEHALSSWRHWQHSYQGHWSQDPWPLLAHVGSASLATDPAELEGGDACLVAALALVTRALLILLAVLALFTLGGWLA